MTVCRDLGPVAYFRNGTGNPLVSYSELGQRWGISKATVGRALKKLSEHGYISMMTFPGRHGTAIFLESYLSTMFQIADVPVDKAEVALCLNIEVAVPTQAEVIPASPIPPKSGKAASVSRETVIVSKPVVEFMALEARKALESQGFSCVGCPRARYKLYPLSDCREAESEAGGLKAEPLRYRLDVACVNYKPAYSFELAISNISDRKGDVCCGK